MKKIKVSLREKPISKGEKKSLYLDYYPPLTDATGKETRREFLGIYLFAKPKSKEERELNKAGKQQAEKVHHKRMGQVMENDFSFVGIKAETTVEMLIKELMDEATNPTSRRHMEILPEQLKTHAQVSRLSWSMFTPEFCQGYLNSLRTQKIKDNGKTGERSEIIQQNTAANYSSAFIKFINRAETRDKVFNIRRKIKAIPSERGNKRDFLSKQELKAIASAPIDRRHIRCREALLFSACTGLRKGDILSLKWNEIIEDNGKHYIHFEQQKGKRTEFFPLNSAATALLGERKGKLVFEGVTTGKVKYMLDYLLPAANIDRKITPHSFRHTFASLLVREGVDIRVIQGLLGHSSLATTSIYAHVGTEEKQKAVDKLDF